MSFLKGLFAAKSDENDSDFVNPITTDIHSHLIPGIDDGVQTVEQSLQLLSALADLGYKKVVTTPHIMGDYYKNGPHNILPGLEMMRGELKKNQIPIELEAAAEYMVDETLEEKIKKREILTFGNNYVLIELPFSREPGNLYNILFSLQINDYQPVLAHPERYEYYGRHRQKYTELFESGILFQLNIFSLAGYYSPEVQKTAAYLIENKMVHLAGSDMHIPLHLPVMQHVLKTYEYRLLCSLNLINNKL